LLEEFTSQKLLGMTDDITKNKALFTKVDKRNETLCVSLSYGRGFELRSCWSRARRFTSANIDPYACIVLLRE